MKYSAVKKLGLALLITCATINSQAGELDGPAPDFTLASNQSRNLKLSEYRGDVIMINFWASWCGPCRQEMPLLDSMYKRYKNLGFTILGVNVEENSADANKVLQKIPVSFPILYDRTNKVSKMYKIDAMPSTIFIDRDGNMRYLHRAYKDGDEQQYDQWIRKLVRE